MLRDDYLIQSTVLPSLLDFPKDLFYTNYIYISKFQLQGNLEIARSMYVLKKKLHFHFMAKEWILWIKTALKVT